MAWNHSGPPLDSAEQLVWSYSLESGYWKHPPLPSWIMHALVALFGPSAGLTFFAAHASTAVALALTWRLGCEFMSPRRSLAAAALTALVGFHGWSSYEYNHNSALLPFQAAVVLCFWLAVQRRQWRWWVLAGACAGLAMLVKYVALLPLAALGLYFLFRRELHTATHVAGALLACGIALAVCAPHLAWLWTHDFPPLQYARAVAVRAPDFTTWARSMWEFLGTQLLQVGPMIAVCAWVSRRRKGTQAELPDQPRASTAFLWSAGAIPAVLLLAFAAITQTELEPRWGSNLYLLSGWLVMDLLCPREAVTASALRAATFAQAILFALVVLVVPFAAALLHWQGRAHFPGDEIARKANAAWADATPAPLRLVVGDVWLAGAVVAHARTSLAVLADGDFRRAPWVEPGDLLQCGALVLQDRSVPESQWRPGVTTLLDSSPTRGEWVVRWAPSHGLHAAGNEGRRIAWGILPPAAGGHCRL
jgi:4-amino-4-deoxy-L-arabinose transferase-like glycosyltransferase